MKHKTLVRIAVVMVIVFGLIVTLYPRMYSPDSAAPVDAAPGAIPAGPAAPGPVAPAPGSVGH